MSVHLIGGGWSDAAAPAVFGGFLAECADRSTTGRPRIRLVVMGTDEESRADHERYVSALALVGPHELAITRVRFGAPCPPDVLDGVDGVLVGGGPTPSYHASLQPLYPGLRDAVFAGLPYAGFSAGAAIAATTAIIGGWRIGDLVVCPEETNEGLDEVTVVQGMGLVEGAVDVHAAQWGTLGRVVAAVDAQLVKGGVSVDESTTLVMNGPHRSVSGAGQVWQVWPAAEGVGVTRLVPG